jgi:hypothetical protein
MGSSLMWDAGRQKVVFVPGNPYELHVYSADGASRRVLPRNDPDFQALPETALRSDPKRLVSQDFVAAVRQLPTGLLVVQVIRQRVTNGGALPEIAPGSYLEVLNPDTGEVAGRANLQLPAGVLCGTSPDGGLYFAAPSGQTREVIARKGRLHAVEP